MRCMCAHMDASFLWFLITCRSQEILLNSRARIQNFLLTLTEIWFQIPHHQKWALKRSSRLNFCLFCAPLSLEKIEAEINVTEFFIDLFDVWLWLYILSSYSSHRVSTKWRAKREDPEMCVESNNIFWAYQRWAVYVKDFCAIFLRMNFVKIDALKWRNLQSEIDHFTRVPS